MKNALNILIISLLLHSSFAFGDAMTTTQDAFKQIDTPTTSTEGDWYSAPLLMAVQHDQPVIVAILLAFGANPNVKNIFGWTPLMYAASEGNIDIIRILINGGADIRVKNMRGDTAERVALHYGQFYAHIYLASFR